MIEDRLKHLEDRVWDETEIRARNETIDELIQEVRRLQGLIKAVEEGDYRCPWCNSSPDSNNPEWHSADCPAFESAGEVR